MTSYVGKSGHKPKVSFPSSPPLLKYYFFFMMLLINNGTYFCRWVRPVFLSGKKFNLFQERSLPQFWLLWEKIDWYRDSPTCLKRAEVVAEWLAWPIRDWRTLVWILVRSVWLRVNWKSAIKVLGWLIKLRTIAMVVRKYLVAFWLARKT